MDIKSELYVENGENKFSVTIDKHYTFNHETVSRVIGILIRHRSGISRINEKLEKHYKPSILTEDENKLISYLVRHEFIHTTYHGYYNATKKNFDKFSSFVSSLAQDRQMCRRNETAMFRDSYIDHLIDNE